MTNDEIIAVVRAQKEGKPIQKREKEFSEEWLDVDDPKWAFTVCDYRVKPMPREWWLNEAYVGYGTKEAAEHMAQQGFKPIHVREVLE